MSDGVSVQPTARETEWHKKLVEVDAFAIAHGRWPSTTAESEDLNDPIKVQFAADEMALAQWWSRVKYYFKKFVNKQPAPGMDASRADAITQLIAKHESLERDGVWDARYTECKNKIETDNKLWSYKDKEHEKTVRWWNQQKTFYRKYRKGKPFGGMTEERANLIEGLLKILGEDTLVQQPMQDGSTPNDQNNNQNNEQPGDQSSAE